MSDWYRTVVWMYGASFFLVIVYAQIISWINPPITARWFIIIELFIILIGLLVGYLVDRHYKKKEKENE